MLNKVIKMSVALAVLAGTFAPVAAPARDRRWHESDRHHHRSDHHRRYKARCRDKGNGGLVIGAIAGGLLGHEVARDKTAGTIIGAGVGGLGGRAIDRKC